MKTKKVPTNLFTDHKFLFVNYGYKQVALWSGKRRYIIHCYGY